MDSDNISKSLPKRITVVDALRGFALVSIMLLHNIERFEVYEPKGLVPSWLARIDTFVWDAFFFLFGGKSYAIFALLFGLTFFIQTHNQQKQGKDFRLRFVWRLVLLLGFGVLNTLFYQGEILVLYALVGFFLIPFTKMGNRAIFISAIIFMMQPELWYKVLLALKNPLLEPPLPAFMPYYMKVGEFLTEGSMLEVMKSNLTNGRMASLFWFWEVGRVSQTLGLFLLGFLAGRKGMFYNTPENKTFWLRTLICSAILFVPLFYLKTNPDIFSDSKIIATSLESIIALWSNFSFMLILVSGFILLFYSIKGQSILDAFSPIGKMSLTNYIIQSIVGATIYYGFGLGMYKYTGATYCLLIGIILAIAQGLFSVYWFKNHKRGPLESLWHRMTWVGTDKK